MRRLAIFSFAFALAALCAGYLSLEEIGRASCRERV